MSAYCLVCGHEVSCSCGEWSPVLNAVERGVQRDFKFVRVDGTTNTVTVVVDESASAFRVALDYGNWQRWNEGETLREAVYRVYAALTARIWHEFPDSLFAPLPPVDFGDVCSLSDIVRRSHELGLVPVLVRRFYIRQHIPICVPSRSFPGCVTDETRATYVFVDAEHCLRLDVWNAAYARVRQNRGMNDASPQQVMSAVRDEVIAA